MGEGGVRGAPPVLPSGRWDVDDVFFSRYFTPIQATGGTVSDVTIDDILYRIHTFTTVGSSQAFEVQSLGTSDGSVEFLVVAGGASSGSGRGAGGGGAGGLVLNEGKIASVTTHPVVVGAGGVAVAGTSGANEQGVDGDNSTFFGATALGGGGGGPLNSPNDGRDGGSGGGGGGGSDIGAAGLGLQPGSASGGFGNNGGVGVLESSCQLGCGNAGGGGAGGVGGDWTSTLNGDGGIGLEVGITGTLTFYAGGGGGAARDTTRSGTGGLGGGGDGVLGGDGQAGAANTGGGGGACGGGNTARRGGDGGSGIVIIRYPLQPV